MAKYKTFHKKRCNSPKKGDVRLSCTIVTHCVLNLVHNFIQSDFDIFSTCHVVVKLFDQKSSNEMQFQYVDKFRLISCKVASSSHALASFARKFRKIRIQQNCIPFLMSWKCVEKLKA